VFFRNSNKLLLGVCLISTMMFAQKISHASSYENPLFGYTHLLPSPFTLPAGTLVYGTNVALGVTDFFQVGTDLVRDFYQIFNVRGKVSLVDYPSFAAGLTLGYETYNYQDINSSNPDLRVNSWLPGAVTAFELLPRLALFVGGNLNFTSATLKSDGIVTSGYVRGVSLGSDISWAYNPAKKRKIGNVLSAGASFDVTYKIVGFGFSHHWPGFHVGIHYYPNADRYKVQPIIAGGGSVSF